MAEKRKRRNGLLKQLGIYPKPSTSEPGINKENNEEKSIPEQDIRKKRRSLRRKQKFLASIGIPSENCIASSSSNCTVSKPNKMRDRSNSKASSSSNCTVSKPNKMRDRSNSKASSSSNCTVSKSDNVRDKSKKNIEPPSDDNSSKLNSKREQPKEHQRPKTKPKPKNSRSRNEIKAKNPKLIETSVLELTPHRSLKAVPTLGFIEEMSPMSFGTPAAKKKCSRKRDPMELSPTFRSKNYKSVLSKKNSSCPEPISLTNGTNVNLSADKEGEEMNKECKLQDVLPNRSIGSSEDEEDEYF